MRAAVEIAAILFQPPSFPYTMDYKLSHDCMIPPCPNKVNMLHYLDCETDCLLINRPGVAGAVLKTPSLLITK